LFFLEESELFLPFPSFLPKKYSFGYIILFFLLVFVGTFSVIVFLLLASRILGKLGAIRTEGMRVFEFRDSFEAGDLTRSDSLGVLECLYLESEDPVCFCLLLLCFLLFLFLLLGYIKDYLCPLLLLVGLSK